MQGEKLALFGATGNTGRAVLALALERGYVVTALVRTPSKLGVTHANLTVLEGGYDATDKIAEAIAASKYVACVAGGPMGQGAYPKDLMLSFASNLLSAIKAAGTVKCFLYQGGFLAATPAEKAGWGLPWGTRLVRGSIGRAVGLEPNLADHEAVMSLLANERAASGLNTIVTLPPMLSQGPAARTLTPGDARSFALNMRGITFNELAVLTLDVLGNEALYGQHVFAATA